MVMSLSAAEAGSAATPKSATPKMPDLIIPAKSFPLPIAKFPGLTRPPPHYSTNSVLISNQKKPSHQVAFVLWHVCT
jgi:hypothetical protein